MGYRTEVCFTSFLERMMVLVKGKINAFEIFSFIFVGLKLEATNFVEMIDVAATICLSVESLDVDNAECIDIMREAHREFEEIRFFFSFFS